MVEILKNKYYYCDNSGCLRRKFDYNKNYKKGQRAGYKRKDGYRYIRIGSKQYLEHHLIWLLHFGYIPKEIDHKNQVRDDNHMHNLRFVDRLENMHNKTIYKTNTVGCIGVHPKRCRKILKYSASIQVASKRIYLGDFKTIDEACKARKEAEIKYGFHKNHGKEKIA